MLFEFYCDGKYEECTEAQEKERHKIIEKAHFSAMRELLKTEKEHILYAITTYGEEGRIARQLIFRNTCLTDSELNEYIEKYPRAVFSAIHSGSRLSCEKILDRRKKRKIKPITLKTANGYVEHYHRHLGGTVGCKFAIGLFEGDNLIGVAICGRPVSRHLDDGSICEINRLCTKGGDENACSMLYGACGRIARDMGYEKIITYTLKSESGITLKASNFQCDGEAGGMHWTGKRNKGQIIPHEMKIRWSKQLAL